VSTLVYCPPGADTSVCPSIEQFSEVERAIQESTSILLDALRQAAGNIERAKRHVGR